ncbi:hypothetical protein PHYBLDRAFT_171284 [Phycomyces blakesleeanus NRRL 1555(-)]|uniref:Uncharacterized protein n=1 Tax=Phycomyces blakesleeanus (strain ATCC 8743b / DSM 1359 / FGSC 10004 / NBRC 33097 / NRRL 1555) TaxID=763407 RepID=A0A167LIG7_PHYB8|nr:hypothetical protein PHYBLDRAFT_171284 [Phycomyces blakesleeanus NRRL 1555(-)]OAD70535.1 hypothetical protein PHYBLDRAFT_171284 [Phycomyces blakesleeanus NRRL 1555(-)]|eukprot:XP_018288575.1 hypothetical protein PHYBLDRAFT_171284 [Phycomyces blakesleeanus NRRL 1555(-)]
MGSVSYRSWQNDIFHSSILENLCSLRYYLVMSDLKVKSLSLYKYNFEAVSICVKNILGVVDAEKKNILFEDKDFVFGENFHPILSVVKQEIWFQIVNECLHKSSFQNHIKV